MLAGANDDDPDGTWVRKLVVAGPLDEIEFLDATWQGLPVWSSCDIWVATDTPDLVYGGPPWPGLLVATRVPSGETLTVSVSGKPPPSSMHQVFASELIVGSHGFWLAAGAESLNVAVEIGNYPVAVWVDGETPGATRRCCIVLGARTPYLLGQPRT